MVHYIPRHTHFGSRMGNGKKKGSPIKGRVKEKKEEDLIWNYYLTKN